MNLYKQARGIQLSGKEFKFYAPWPVAMPKQSPTPEYREIWKNAFGLIRHISTSIPPGTKLGCLSIF
jgi:hypothetical protein